MTHELPEQFLSLTYFLLLSYELPPLSPLVPERISGGSPVTIFPCS